MLTTKALRAGEGGWRRGAERGEVSVANAMRGQFITLSDTSVVVSTSSLQNTTLLMCQQQGNELPPWSSCDTALIRSVEARRDDQQLSHQARAVQLYVYVCKCKQRSD
ncbi:hypothetical protein ACLOJK_041764 [Asimina triloba]